MEVKKTKFSEISNTAFILFIIFLISFLWCNFYFHNLKTALICSIIIMFAFSIIYIPHKVKKYKNDKNAFINTEKNNYYKNQLLLSNNTDIFNFITRLYNYTNCDIIAENHIVCEKRLDIYIAYSENPLSNDDIYNFYKNSKTSEIFVFTLFVPKQIIKMKEKKLTVYDFHELLTKCHENKLFFDNNINVTKNKKYKLKDALCIVLGKERSKSYLLLGLLILFSSMLTPYNIYYIIISTILFGLSIFSKFNTIFN